MKNYRVHETDSGFYIQIKTIFGWIYKRERLVMNTPSILFGISSVVVTLFFLIIDITIVLYFLPLALFILANVAYFVGIVSFTSLQYAKEYIRVQLVEEKKEKKIKKSKYHYLNIKDERMDKLNSLKS